MARSEARISVSIWDDQDFLALPPGAQRMFLFLLSQRDLAHTGVIALRERRWSKASAGLTPAAVTEQLTTLQETRFVVIDEDAEELLVRSFIRRDKVYRQPNVLKAAQDHLSVISSPRILEALAVELTRVAHADDLVAGSAPIVAEMLAFLPNPSGKGSGKGSSNGSGDPSGVHSEAHPEPSTGPADKSSAARDAETAGRVADQHPSDSQPPVSPGDEGSGNPSGNPSGKASRGAPGERGVVTVVSSASPSPFPLSPSPSPLGAPPAPQPRKREPKPQTQVPSDFSITEEMRIWAKEHTPTVAGDLGLQAIRFVNYWTERAERSDKKALKSESGWAMAWQNWLIKAVEIQGGRPAGSTSARPAFTGQNLHHDANLKWDNPFRPGVGDQDYGQASR